MSSKKMPVSINVLPTLDYVELIQFDDRSGEIDKAASLPCEFDPVSRQMVDRDVVMQTIRDLYNMNRIPFNTPAVLVLPSFFTREIELPTEFSKEELRFALVSEAERFYIFKKVEPQIDWINLDESRLLYSALPKVEVEKYVKIFQELRIPLLGIELGYFSILRGLVATGAVQSEIENASRWCLLAVSDSSFFASIQDGVSILKTMDAPLSVTTDDDLSMVQEIQQDFETFVEMESFSKLVLVNNATRISSDELLGRLSHQGNLILIEQNGETLRSRGDGSEGQFPCSLEGLGGVFYRHFPEMPHLNFIPETGEDVAGILNYRVEAIKWLLISNGAIFLICLMIWGAFALLLWQKDQERETLSKKSVEIGNSIDTTQLSEVNRKKFIKKVVDRNVLVNNLLVKLGTLAKNEVWFDKFEVDAEKIEQPLSVLVEGGALELNEANRLVAPLNELLQGGDLEVSSAAQTTSSDGQAYFTWTIQNKAPAKPEGQAEGGG